MKLYWDSVEGDDADLGNNGKEARQEERRLCCKNLQQKESEKLDKMQERMGSRKSNEKRYNNDYYKALSVLFL